MANSYVISKKLNEMQPFYPLHTFVCDHCFLVQLDQFESPHHIFNDYAYFSSFSDSWLTHAKKYVDMMIERFKLNSSAQVIEVASNDGYLLQYFVVRSIPVLGIEPAQNVAESARLKGIPTIVNFFGRKVAESLSKQGKQADVLVCNNVLAHVPDLHDFVSGLKIALHPKGVLTLEFPWLLQLMRNNQFDTIYHEHFSYFSLMTAISIFSNHGLTVFDVEELETHGGSLRLFVKHTEDESKTIQQSRDTILDKEKQFGLEDIKVYTKFSDQVAKTKRVALDLLIRIKRDGKTIVGYGAPAKGNTLLNYCGIGRDFIDYTVDRNEYKQNCFLPGTHIPIESPAKIFETKPDYILILPWNLKKEIMVQMSSIHSWGGQFIVLIPEAKVI